MTSYRLMYHPLGSPDPVNLTFEAFGLEHAYARAAEIIAEAHGMPGAHVALERSSGNVTVGAGYRSYRGTFRLVSVATDASEVSAADEVRSLTG